MSHSKCLIQEDSFSSDTELNDDPDESSTTDVDAKLEEDDVFDTQFFKCYSALKKNDSKIYDKNVKFFESTDPESSDAESQDEQSLNQNDSTSTDTKRAKSREPKMTLLDHQLAVNPDDIEEPMLNKAKVDLTKEVSKSFYEKELEEIKKSIERVGADINSESDDDLLVVKSSSETKRKPSDKLKTILDKIEDEEDEDLQHLKGVWSDPKNLSDEDRFLRDYILNKRYLPHSNEDDEIADDEDEGEEFFSKNIDELSDADDDKKEKGEASVKRQTVQHHSDEKGFDNIARIPRNSTKTIRDLVEKQEKKERRLKKIEKEKRKKKALKSADCEDMVGDLPTKFHYRETEPNDYGLTAEEILLATDKELDEWVSLRDCIAYKTPEEEKADRSKFAAKANDIELKKKIFKSIYSDPATQTDEQADQSNVSGIQSSPKRKKRRSKRKRKSESESSFKESANGSALEKSQMASSCDVQETPMSNRQRKKRRKKRGTNHKKFAKIGVAPDRLLAYGISKTKLKKSKVL